MDRPATVVVDGRLLRRRSTGVATYIRELATALHALTPHGLRISVATGPPALPRRNRVTRVGNLVLDLLWLHIGVPLLARLRGARAIHAPVNWLPWWSPLPTVVTVQDVAWERVPDAYPAFFRHYARLFTRRSVSRADLVIATSGSTARDLEQLYGVAPERIRRVPIGVVADPDPPFGPREPFVLHVGEFEPRKRVPDLIEGHRRYLAAAGGPAEPCRLVLAGQGGRDEARVRELAGPDCDLLGFVGPDRLSSLYRRATLVVVTSRYEGFGLPVAEAMAHGCPVLVADNSSLPEVAGASGLVLHDASPAGIADGLARALADRAALAERGRAGWEDARDRFLWANVAQATADVYREVIG
jgi:glycosyltransferase involved in cell wall biosynthesis